MKPLVPRWQIVRSMTEMRESDEWSLGCLSQENNSFDEESIDDDLINSLSGMINLVENTSYFISQLNL